MSNTSLTSSTVLYVYALSSIYILCVVKFYVASIFPQSNHLELILLTRLYHSFHFDKPIHKIKIQSNKIKLI